MVSSSASGSIVAGLVDSGCENAIRMTFSSPQTTDTAGIQSILTVWMSFVKVGAPASSSSATTSKPSKAVLSSDPQDTMTPPKRDSLRTARSGHSGARAVSASSDTKAKSSSSGGDSPPKSDNSTKPVREKKEKSRTKEKEEKEVESEVAKKDELEESTDEDFVDAPPRRRAKAKPNLVPEDEDPEDFWNGTSKSKTQEKKKDIKKLQQSLESMTINLKSSWKAGQDNEQQRFAVMIRDIAEVNALPRACAGFRRTGEALQVRVAFAVDLSADKASGCGIDTSQWICLELSFPDTVYLSKAPSAASKTLAARQVPPVSGEALMTMGDLKQFGLWWTAEQRLSERLLKDWPSIVESAAQVTKMVASSQSSLGLGSPDAWAILEILEWPTSNLPLALKALEAAKSDVKAALELALDEDWLAVAKVEVQSRQDRETKSKKSKKKKGVETVAEDIEEEQDAASSFGAVLTDGSTGSSFLIYVIQLTKQLLEDSAKYCPICNNPHPLELFKPIVCGNELCKFQFSNMGLGVNFEAELIHSPQAVDLLISLTSKAIRGNHFDPFPHEVSRQVGGATIALKTADDVAKVLAKCPSVDDMVALAEVGALRATLAEAHPLLYLLLRWIITSSRAHLHFLKPDDQIAMMHTQNQFHLKSTPPEKEQKFYAAKKKYGSFFAWHGSPDYNWHSILRNGLRNYSSTKHQINGAAYGPGVYMAVDSGTSTGYSRAGDTNPAWPHSRYSADTIVLALCEVIDEGSALCTGNVHRPHCFHSHSAPYYRIEKDEYITTRYLFVVTPYTASVMAEDVAKHIKTKQLLRSNKGGSKPISFSDLN